MGGRADANNVAGREKERERERERGRDDNTYVHQESNSRLTQNSEHGCRVGVEQGHTVGELVAHDQVSFGVVLS